MKLGLHLHTVFYCSCLFFLQVLNLRLIGSLILKKKWNWIVLMDQYYVCSMCLYEKLLKNKTIWMHIKLFGLLICHVLAPVAIRGSWSLLSETMINLSHFGLIGNHTNMKYERWLWTDVQQRTSQTTESIPAHWIVKIFVWNHWTVYKQYHWY
jgi:hypothetical protein